MSKLRPIYVIIPGILLTIVVICVFAFVLLPPVNKEIKSVSEQRDTEQAKADERPQVEERLAEAERNLDEQTEKLHEYMATRSIPLSTYQPVEAMITLWFELQEDLAPALEEFIESSGCRITGGATLPQPQMQKPTLGPSNFLRLPSQGSLNFTVEGTMDQIRTLYRSLSNFKRVATIENLSLRPTGGEKLSASFSLVVYLLAEGPEGAGGGGGAAAAPTGMMPGQMSGMPSGQMGVPGPSGPSPSTAVSPTSDDAEAAMDEG